MKLTAKKRNKRAAFTIIELLTVMSIIVILISLLVPALSRVRRYAKRVKQSAQFHSIGVAMDLFNAEFDYYPDSEELDSADPQQSYCGAMKLAEAMVGQDLLGFHPDSLFRNDLTMDGTNYIYASPSNSYVPTPDNLLARRGPYLELENANAYRLYNLYGSITVTSNSNFDEERYVLCDVYTNVSLVPAFDGDTVRGKTGMPILYYEARLSGTTHPTVNNAVTINDLTNIYDYRDNDELVQLGMPFEPGAVVHLMDSRGGNTRHIDPATSNPVPSNAMNFYDNIYNENITSVDRPYRSETYILLSAGFDGEYGTEDDVFNFER